MIKVITPGAYDFDGPSARLVDLHRDGRISADWLVKSSAADIFAHTPISPPEPGRSRIHLIALGDADYYGFNRNGDAYYKTAHVIDLPEPDWETQKLADGSICKKSADTFADRTEVGNAERVHTFTKFAKVYKHHLNEPKKGHKVWGDVTAAAHNDKMSRSELLIDVPTDEWAGDLQKLAKGEDLSFSQSCVLDPDYPVLTSKGYKPIASVAEGDQVLTHNGKWQVVTATNRRVYTGEVVDIKLNGLPFTLELTADHPMWAKVFSGSRQTAAMGQKAARFFKDPEAFEKAPADWVHATHLAEGDRLFYQPTPNFPASGAIDDEDLATLLGYYLAEGSLGFNNDRACSVEYTCNMSDSLPRRVPEIVARAFPGTTCTLRPDRVSKVCLRVTVFNTEFAEFVRRFVGRGGPNKYICPEIFNARPEVKLAFLGAWMDGDGTVGKKGGLWATAYRNLVLQGRDLLASLGIPSSIYHNYTPERKIREGTRYVAPATEWWSLNISHLDLWQLAPYSEKAGRYPVPTSLKRTKAACMRPSPDGRYAYRIKSVHRRYVSEVMTYNIEVANDESYTLAGLISHNCRVPSDICSRCGHKSPSRKKYCEHLQKHMTEMDKSGHVTGAVNDWMTYFDISRVHRPADRIAWSLAKAAGLGAVVDHDDLVEYHAHPDISVLAASQPGRIGRRLGLLAKAAEIEKQIPYMARLRQLGPAMRLTQPKSLSHLAGRHTKSAEFFRALADRQILLPLEPFLQVVLGPERLAKVAQYVSEATNYLPHAWAILAFDEEADQVAGNTAYDPASRATDGACIKTAQDLESALSMAPEPLRQRHIASVLRGEPPVSPIIKCAAHTTTDTARSLVDQYLAYQLAYLEHVSISNPQDLDRVLELTVLQNHVQ